MPDKAAPLWDLKIGVQASLGCSILGRTGYWGGYEIRAAVGEGDVSVSLGQCNPARSRELTRSPLNTRRHGFY